MPRHDFYTACLIHCGATGTTISTRFGLAGSNDDWHKWEWVLCASCSA